MYAFIIANSRLSISSSFKSMLLHKVLNILIWFDYNCHQKTVIHQSMLS